MLWTPGGRCTWCKKCGKQTIPTQLIYPPADNSSEMSFRTFCVEKTAWTGLLGVCAFRSMRVRGRLFVPESQQTSATAQTLWSHFGFKFLWCRPLWRKKKCLKAVKPFSLQNVFATFKEQLGLVEMLLVLAKLFIWVNITDGGGVQVLRSKSRGPAGLVQEPN